MATKLTAKDKVRVLVDEVIRQGLGTMERSGVPFDAELVGTYFLLVGLKIALLDPDLGTVLETSLMLDKSGEKEAQESVARLKGLIAMVTQVKES
ncbi:hypothetical protein LCGC14_2241100 [marine sediment metagenome]|uniref:Uncharacterized protein n=1 Tax=marine sediment metagenome TaxID=412755 RepID=A0A0F9D562_9ZZZZ